MRYQIEKRDRFKCIKTFRMEDDNEIAYAKGITYLSEVDHCITDKQGDTHHNMAHLPEFFEHFQPLMK